MKKIAFACDHAAYELKEAIKQYVVNLGYKVEDFGTYSTDSCDYADFAHPAAEAVEEGRCDIGIAMCGSGNGIQMTLNKHQGIRAALCWIPEIATLAREHNDANFLVMPGRYVSIDEGIVITNAFLDTAFQGGRHLRRINKIPVNHPSTND